ncbi:MAG TPA: hypothetical protein VL947_05875, partial [Cytophagales bacterium]|nr:hypothetical protein [Cytophagales bacterium]
MKKHIFFGFLQFIGTYAYAQCECYSVQNIEVTTDTTIAVTLKNTCDNNVYMNGYLIDLSNDTIARNECWCIAASPLLEEAKFDFTSKTSILPALSTL